MARGQCDYAKQKICKKKTCPCYHVHTIKSTCAGGCDDHHEQICVSISAKLLKCQTPGCEEKFYGSKNREYCDKCKDKRHREATKKRNKAQKELK